jgi:hypothetical protein
MGILRSEFSSMAMAGQISFRCRCWESLSPRSRQDPAVLRHPEMIRSTAPLDIAVAHHAALSLKFDTDMAQPGMNSLLTPAPHSDRSWLVCPRLEHCLIS